MKLLFSFLLVLTSVIFFDVSIAKAEIIPEFSADYTINEDGSVLVDETIYYDFESASKHGIFRYIEKKHPQPATAWYKSRSIDIEIQSVTKNGLIELYTLTESKSQIEVKIGDADKTISGQHTYQIRYRLLGALSSGDKGAEFYWNVTGNDWPISIINTSVKVRGGEPDIIKGNFECYQGFIGEKNSCLKSSDNNQVVYFEANNLMPGEGLTIATEINPEAVAFLNTERISLLPLGVFLAIIWIIYYSRKVYLHRMQDRIIKPVIPQYEPYGNYLPMYTGVLFDGRLNPHDITAGIVYLAEQGFLKITRLELPIIFSITKTDYQLTLLRPISEIPNEFLKMVAELMFKGKELDVTPGTVLLSNLNSYRAENSAIIRKLNSAIDSDLKSTGIMTNTLPPWTMKKTKLLMLLIVVFGFFMFVEGGSSITFLVVACTVVLSIVAIVDRRTAKGHEIKNHLEGFKLFLSVTDKERFDFHNAPEKSPELFMKYLPYAIALQVESKWAEVFKDITLPKPDWYDGTDFNTFSAVAITQDLASFSTSFSASSGTSGSSGGGSSGGGGGGGGGGSW